MMNILNITVGVTTSTVGVLASLDTRCESWWWSTDEEHEL